MRYPLNETTKILKIFLMINMFFWFMIACFPARDMGIYPPVLIEKIDFIFRWEVYCGIVLIRTFFHLISFMVFVVWIYFATFNMQLAFGRQSISPRWAAGWNFVPIANFVMVYCAMANLCRHFSPKTSKYGFLLLWWLWSIVMLCITILFELFLMVAMIFPSMESFITSVQLFVCAGCFFSNIMEMRIVTLITQGEARVKVDAFA